MYLIMTNILAEFEKRLYFLPSTWRMRQNVNHVNIIT